MTQHQKIDDIAAKIAADCDTDYEDGPCDGAEACDDAAEFADYWLNGVAGDEVRRQAKMLGLNEDALWVAADAALREIYDPKRHGADC